MKKRSKYHDMRLSRREFRQYVELVVEELPGAESFEYFVEFLTNSVEVTHALYFYKAFFLMSDIFSCFQPNLGLIFYLTYMVQ